MPNNNNGKQNMNQIKKEKTMKRFLGLVALLMGMVTGANAQVNDTIQRVAGNDLYQGMTRKLPYRQMVTPCGVQVTDRKSTRLNSSHSL